MRAIVLAAGRGSRLSGLDASPKPLVRLAGKPLLLRTLESLAGGGAREAVVVVGYQADVIRAEVAGWTTPIPVRFVQNDRWEKSNGLSVLAAAAEVEHGSFLSMTDHLLGGALVRAVAAFPLDDGDAVLGVDRDIPGCFDLDDATKVRLGPSGIVAIGKELDRYDAIDTGLFRIGPALLEHLRAAEAARGDASLSDGVRHLAASGRMRACDVTGAFWQDVDTPESFAEGERRLRGQDPGS